VQINRILIWSLWANLSLSFSVSTGNCDSGIPGSSQVGTFRAVASSLSRAMTGFCKISYKKDLLIRYLILLVKISITIAER
jgi:hypothetical protein